MSTEFWIIYMGLDIAAKLFIIVSHRKKWFDESKDTRNTFTSNEKFWFLLIWLVAPLLALVIVLAHEMVVWINEHLVSSIDKVFDAIFGEK